MAAPALGPNGKKIHIITDNVGADRYGRRTPPERAASSAKHMNLSQQELRLLWSRRELTCTLGWFLILDCVPYTVCLGVTEPLLAGLPPGILKPKAEALLGTRRESCLSLGVEGSILEVTLPTRAVASLGPETLRQAQGSGELGNLIGWVWGRP